MPGLQSGSFIMPATQTDIINQLRRSILDLQGYKTSLYHDDAILNFGPIKHAFSNNTFPTGAIHEFLCEAKEDTAATTGFIAGITSALMRKGNVSIWISTKRNLFPPALKSFGISPEKIIFIDVE